MEYTKINETAWDHLSDGKYIWTLPISSEEYAAAKKGEVRLFLTPKSA